MWPEFASFRSIKRGAGGNKRLNTSSMGARGSDFEHPSKAGLATTPAVLELIRRAPGASHRHKGLHSAITTFHVMRLSGQAVEIAGGMGGGRSQDALEPPRNRALHGLLRVVP